MTARDKWVAEMAGLIDKQDGATLAHHISLIPMDVKFLILKDIESATMSGKTKPKTQKDMDTLVLKTISSICTTLNDNLQLKINNGSASKSSADRMVESQALVQVIVAIVGAQCLISFAKHEPQDGIAASNELLSTFSFSSSNQSQDPTQNYANVAKVNYASHAFQLLLWAFDRFMGLHMVTREQISENYNCGWDTAILVTLVRVIQKSSRLSNAVDEEGLGSVVRNWRKLYIFLQDADLGIPNEKSRRRGALTVVNALLTMLFQHNNYHQCRVILSNLEHIEALAAQRQTDGILKAGWHMKAEVSKYYYYTGRLKLTEKNFVGAFQAFREAYGWLPPFADVEKLTSSCRANKQRVLFYWIISMFCSGYEPPSTLMEDDPFLKGIFEPIVDTLAEGNINRYIDAVDANGAIFRLRGVYMLLLGLRPMCTLHLLQRVHAYLLRLQVEQNAGKLEEQNIQTIDPSRISLHVLVAAMSAVSPASNPKSSTNASNNLGEEEDDLFTNDRKRKRSSAENDELGARPNNKNALLPENCLSTLTPEEVHALKVDSMALWIARLVTKGYVKGYMSYEHSTLVLSKKDPFPVVVTLPS